MNVVSVANIQIGQFDNLYSLNDLHRAAGGLEKHKPANWLRNQQTTDLIAELEKAQIRAIQKKQKLGTFVCKELVVHYGMWISPAFSLKVIRAFLDTQEEASASPKTTADERTGLRQAVSALVGKCGIDYSSAYNMVHQRFGVAAIEDISADKLNDAVQYVHTLTLHSGLNGEVLDRLPEKLQARKIAIDERTLISIGRLLLYAQEQRCFVSRYLPAFENLGIGGRGKLWSFVHDTDPVFEHIRRFFTGQCPALGHWAKDSDLDWLHRRILSTAEA